MGDVKLFEREYYKKAISLYDEGMKRVEQMKNKREDAKDVAAFVNVQMKAIEEILTVGKEKTIDEIKEKNIQIKKDYHLKREYSSPEQEMLQRQDWDLKLSNMNPAELSEFIEQLDDYAITNYQYETLKRLFNNNPDKNKNNLMKLMMYSEKNKVGKEYELTEDWQTNQKLMIELSTYSPKFLWKFSMQEGKHQILNYYSDFNNLLIGYNVSLG